MKKMHAIVFTSLVALAGVASAQDSGISASRISDSEYAATVAKAQSLQNGPTSAPMAEHEAHHKGHGKHHEGHGKHHKGHGKGKHHKGGKHDATPAAAPAPAAQ
ncbi:hypothetical protein [Glaciimonas soli]|uniref:Uncharacterized protein n=1 Tax=Glaciimonas soli TaxID=2590999 RepID=A0A843YR19_9BURK|nr:hypothetical protein [Glaciimonas soli]MQR01985.1 hypothetical protein [Glaciimonas soli]